MEMNKAYYYQYHEYKYSTTESVEYTICDLYGQVAVMSYTGPVPPICGFMTGKVASGDQFIIHCLELGADKDDDDEVCYYYDHYKRELIGKLSSRYSNVSEGCFREVAETFVDFLKSTNAEHRCPSRPPLEFSIEHMVDIIIHAPQQLCPRPWPATKASIRELYRKMEEEDEEGFDPGVCCAICLVEMEALRSTLAMPCSHRFHQVCLCQWLRKNYVCPICRYQLS